MARPSTKQGYTLAAKRRVREYLSQNQSAVRVELMMHLAEYYYRSTDNPDHYNIDPHIAGPAIGQMTKAGELVQATEQTRGGRAITTFFLNPALPRRTKTLEDAFNHSVASRPSLTTAQQRAAARKRLLYARYLSWTSGSKSRAGTAGPAAEEAERIALAGVPGLAPLAANFGPVARIEDLILPGPLDSGAAVATSPLIPPTLALIEVKNVRDWIYPNSEEPWQLIWKSLHVSTERPSWRIVPVLVCRRCHPTLIWMAQSLGMLIVETYSAPMGPVDQQDLDPVRRELSLNDLKTGNEPPAVLRRWTANTLPSYAGQSADRWAETVADPTCRSLLLGLALTRTDPTRATRDPLLTRLDTRCRQLGRRGWEATRLIIGRPHAALTDHNLGSR